MTDCDGILPIITQGEYRASLEAVRDRLAAGIDGATDRQLVHLAPLCRQLADVLRALDEMPDPTAVADTVRSAQSVVESKLRSVQ